MTNPASYKDILEQSLNENNSADIPVGGIEFESEAERCRYLVSVFPGLVKKGKFVEAMALVHGNERFNGFYRLFDRFSKWLVKKTEQKTAGKEQTVHEHILDQAA